MVKQLSRRIGKMVLFCCVLLSTTKNISLANLCLTAYMIVAIKVIFQRRSRTCYANLDIVI